MTDYKKLTDDELIKLILSSGELHYFGELYDRYSNKVFRKCYAMVQNEADAEDLTQTILTKTMLNISKFKGNSSFSTWLFRITYNACLDHFRLRKKKRKIFTEDSDTDRMLLIMKYQDRMTVPVIAESLDISESAVKMRLHRARKRVLDAYNEKF